jgi:hypothetical protein
MAGSSAVPTTSTWTVDSQLEQTQGGPQGIVRGVLISFTTGLGNKGTVFVSDAQYSVAAARTALQARAELLDAVSQLSAT